MTVLRFFETSGTACLATEVSLQNVTRITDTYVKTNIHILSNLSQFPLSEQRFGGKAVETSKHILCAAIFSPNIMPFMTKWKNMVQQDRPHDNTVLAHCMLDNKGYQHTHSICNPYCLSTTTVVVRTRLCYVIQSPAVKPDDF